MLFSIEVIEPIKNDQVRLCVPDDNRFVAHYWDTNTKLPTTKVNNRIQSCPDHQLDNTFIAVKAGLMATAIGVASGVQERFEYPRQLVEMVLNYLSEGVDGCDHSVGICQCSDIAVLDELNLALEGKERCSKCFGDGIGEQGGEEVVCSNCAGNGWILKQT